MAVIELECGVRLNLLVSVSDHQYTVKTRRYSNVNIFEIKFLSF